ncbi:MAG: tRNA lysidine(34) synthetase TilS [Nitrospirae bacterium]|nr:tRNA lysidine(34) synthetase TilS [Candidatus Troglogloeales bacterium]MBI3598966.1 tRNA lysidine(34) synthetase TilS [Candidatus Troglogloeales bacterium]
MRQNDARHRHKETPLLKTFSESLSKLSIHSADKVVVAVSGGADSICLLHLFLKAGFFSCLHVAHLNHGFREESDQEALFVEKLCQSLSVPCTVAKRNVLETCRKMRLSKQEGARFVRYGFLHEVATVQRADYIALGHTADDQVETILISRLRGAGPTGLRGMVQGAQSRDDKEHVIIRPMLSITRNQIIAELKDSQIAFVEDPSNQDMRYLRNRVRHELIPLLAEYNPRIREAILRETILLEDENDFIETQLAQLLPKLDLVSDNSSVSFDLSLFSSLHLALKRRLLRWGITQLRGSCRGIGFEHIEAILTKKRLCFPNGITATKIGTRLILTAAIPKIKRTSVSELGIPKEPSEIDLPQWNLRLVLSVHTPPYSPPPCSILFDFDTISHPLTIRGFRLGDRFCPLGMKGRHKKLQDFFVDVKVPKEKRDQIALLVCPAGIIWVIGLRQDERFKVTEKTKRILSIQTTPLLF